MFKTVTSHEYQYEEYRKWRMEYKLQKFTHDLSYTSSNVVLCLMMKVVSITPLVISES